ncbi:unnamed protein product [Effrenium voratum]|uniref:N-acetyltransferase domain-containing protein n=1 Tax=Effrenium voratum TaxID=2562239 RepID=A0AA36JDQ5_9DINO|nr:unnamed protein product [Effrenium voratum]
MVGASGLVVLSGSLVSSAVPGDVVVLGPGLKGGVLRFRWPAGGGRRLCVRLVVEANDLRPLNQARVARMAPKPTANFLAASGTDRFSWRRALIRAVAPHLQGLEVPKLAVLLVLLGEKEDDTCTERRWSHFDTFKESGARTRLGVDGNGSIGDPGTGKTQLLQALLGATGFACWHLKCQDSESFPRSRARRRVFPARLAEGNERLQDESLLSFDVEADGETVTVEAMLPQERDLDLISRLLAESFMETLQPWMLPEQLGLLAKAWNWLVFEWERQIILAALNVNYKKILTAPSLRRPIGWQFEGESLALLLVARRGNGDQEAVAFCELSVLPPDGRPPDDMLSTLLMVFNKSPNAQPYLQNFCVAPAWRRRSLGRKLLGLAEQVVREVWRSDRLYLHAGGGKAAEVLYRLAGYEATGLAVEPTSLHMSKSLEKELELQDA